MTWRCDRLNYRLMHFVVESAEQMGLQAIQDVRKQLAAQVQVPMKVAVMGCIVNGPGEAEGADVAVFAGDRRGIIYVQGERVANVPEEEILPRLLAECLGFQDKVRAGLAKLGEKKVQITPPDPIGELGSGWEKVAAGQVQAKPEPDAAVAIASPLPERNLVLHRGKRQVVVTSGAGPSRSSVPLI